jgi:transposase
VVEDCRHLTRTLEGDLLRAGERIVRVPTKPLPGARRSAREAGRSGSWTRSRSPARPGASRICRSRALTAPNANYGCLVDHRDDLVFERTLIRSRIRCHLRELDPTLVVRSRGLRSQRVVDQVTEQLAGPEGTIAEILREQLARVRELNQRALELERQILLLVIRLAPSPLAIAAVALTAAKIVGETADVRRFRSKSAYGRHEVSAFIEKGSAAFSGSSRSAGNTRCPRVPTVNGGGGG